MPRPTDLPERPVEWWVDQVCEAWMHPMPERPEFELRIAERLTREWPRLAATLEGLALAREKANASATVVQLPAPPKRRRWRR